MKLLTVIVQEVDAEQVAQGLRDAGHRFTRYVSAGGFLGTPNITLLLAVEDDAVPSVVEVIRLHVTVREVDLPLVLSERLRDWQEGSVNYAGATIMVGDLVDVIRI